jgi:hypothetical protein
MVSHNNTKSKSFHLPMSLFTISEDANPNCSSSSSNQKQEFESPLSLSPVYRSYTSPLCFREEDENDQDEYEYEYGISSNSHAIVMAALNIVTDINTMTAHNEEEEEEQHLAACPHNNTSSASSSSRWDAAFTTCAAERNSSLKMPSPSIRRTRRNSIPSRSVSLSLSSPSSRSSVVDRPPTCPVRRGRNRSKKFKAVAASVA